MRTAHVMAEILKREGVEFLVASPGNPLIEAAAELHIRPILVRQERTGLHIADGFSRQFSGERVGVFTMQFGPGVENAFGAVAQAYSESVPLVVLPSGYPRHLTNVYPNFSALLNYKHVTKLCEQLTAGEYVSESLRRAFTQARNGRPGPALVEIPKDVYQLDTVAEVDYRPTSRFLSSPDLSLVERVADLLLAAERPVVYAGQGVHYARAWAELQEFAELLEAPVTTSLAGKSSFPEDHGLSLGAAGRAVPDPVLNHIRDADVVFGIGCSFSRSSYALAMPRGKTYVHATLDPGDVNKDIDCEYALVGDAKLTLRDLNAAIRSRLNGRSRGRRDAIAANLAEQKRAWLSKWLPLLTSNEVPLSPYRVLWDLMHTVDVSNSIITHDAGYPRDQLSPFWRSTTPLSYIGWGKTTQLGYGLGLIMGAKLARRERLAINVWGDAAMGMTGFDIETAVREQIPILSILLNNSSMAIERGDVPLALERFGTTNLSGNYAGVARELGAYSERVSTPEEIVPSIKRGVRNTLEGRPALLEFVTRIETRISGSSYH